MGSGREAARSRARLCHTPEMRRSMRRAAEVITWRGASHLQEFEPVPETNEPRPSARGPGPGQRASTSSGQPRGATRRKRWASASREGRARRAAAGNKDRFDRPSLLPVSASLQPFPSHTHTRLPVVLSTCPQLHLTFSHIPTPFFGEGRAALAPAPRTSPAPPLRPGTSCLLARPCSCSHLPLAKKFRLLLCFAPPARLFCWCCRDRECACAFGFTALGRFPGRVLLGDDSLTGSARVGALSLNPSSCFSFVSLLGKTMSR